MQAEWVADLADLHCRRPISNSERVNADIYQELLRQHVVPWVQRDVAWKKDALRRIQRRPTLPKSVSGRGRILVFGRLDAIFAEL
jgi:hypothetical protein